MFYIEMLYHQLEKIYLRILRVIYQSEESYENFLLVQLVIGK